MPSPIPTKLRVLTRDEIKQLLAVAHGHPNEALLLLALAAGLRRGELVALRWADSDLEQGILTVRRTVESIGTLGEPKTGQRMLVLPTVLVGVLQRHRERQNEMRQAAGTAWQNHDLVFTTMDGDFRQPDHLSRHVEELTRHVDISPISFHALRRTTTSLLLEAGIPPAVVQAILGIHRVASPLAHLSPLSLALYREAAAKVDALFRAFLTPAPPEDPSAESSKPSAEDQERSS